MIIIQIPVVLSFEILEVYINREESACFFQPWIIQPSKVLIFKMFSVAFYAQHLPFCIRMSWSANDRIASVVLLHTSPLVLTLVLQTRKGLGHTLCKWHIFVLMKCRAIMLLKGSFFYHAVLLRGRGERVKGKVEKC